MTETETAVEMEIKSAETNKEENKTQNDSSTAIATVTGNQNKILDELFFVFYKFKISGPFNKYEILRLYVTNKFEKKIWIKKLKFADKEGSWCIINLPKSETEHEQEKEPENEENNKDLKQYDEELYEYLIPEINCKEIKQFDPPVDIPEDANKLWCGAKIIQYLGRLLAVIGVIIIILHIIGIGCFALCCWTLPYYLFAKDTKILKKDDGLIGGTIFVTYLGLIVTPIFIVYFVLLESVDKWHEIQSWMIAYISWGICSWLLTIVIVVGNIASGDADFDSGHKLLFWIIGIDYDSINIEGLEDNGPFVLSMFLLYPSLAALLPSAIIGFIANFVLEEKFELKCSEDIESNTLCFDDEYGCCEVISSHDYQNTYAFVGGLASNILATWAIIRIIGYLVVNISPEISMFAKKHK